MFIEIILEILHITFNLTDFLLIIPPECMLIRRIKLIHVIAFDPSSFFLKCL